MATSPQYAATPGRTNIGLSSANTASDGSGSLVQMVAGSANGRRIRRVAVSLASSSNRIHFYISPDGGTTKRFLCDVLLPGSSPGASARAAYAEVPELVGVILANANAILYAATHVAQPANVDCEYADL